MSRRGNEIARALCEKVERCGLPIDTVDWQQVRIQASIAAMQGMLSSKETMESIAKQARKLNVSIPTALAELSVGDADALIAKLKGEQDDNNH